MAERLFDILLTRIINMKTDYRAFISHFLPVFLICLTVITAFPNESFEYSFRLRIGQSLLGNRHLCIRESIYGLFIIIKETR